MPVGGPFWLHAETLAGQIPTLTDAVGPDGVSLISASHPTAKPLRPWRSPMLRRESLVTVRIEVPASQCREVDWIYGAMADGYEFNQNFDKPALIRLARERCEERLARKFVRRRRYLRRHSRR